MTEKKNNSESPYTQYKNMADDAIALQILDIIENSPDVSQRKITVQTGIAAGLVHSFMKKVISKGYVRAKQVSAKRWLYFITPDGFIEKSRLTYNYLSRTLNQYQHAQGLVQAHLAFCLEQGWKNLVVAGVNDLSEIAALNIKAHDELTLVGVLGNGAGGSSINFDPLPYEAVKKLEYDRILICDVGYLEWREAQADPPDERHILFVSNIHTA